MSVMALYEGSAPDLCPRCGAYWRCGCVIEVAAAGLSAGEESCEHDWSPAVGVDTGEANAASLQVLLCRRCGLYKAVYAGGDASQED
jgi:hypothetical protein